jgi:hypothetical protein
VQKQVEQFDYFYSELGMETFSDKIRAHFSPQQVSRQDAGYTPGRLANEGPASPSIVGQTEGLPSIGQIGEKPRWEAGQAGDKLLAGTGGEEDLALSNRRLVEEIAAVRYSLRRVLALALESEGTAEYVHLVEIYGNGCLRLVRLLKKEGGEQDRLESYVRELVDAARKEIPRLLGWRD